METSLHPLRPMKTSPVTPPSGLVALRWLCRLFASPLRSSLHRRPFSNLKPRQKPPIRHWRRSWRAWRCLRLRQCHRWCRKSRHSWHWLGWHRWWLRSTIWWGRMTTRSTGGRGRKGWWRRRCEGSSIGGGRRRRRKNKLKNRESRKKSGEERMKKEKKRKESELKVAAGESLSVCLITEMPLKIEYGNWKHLKCVFSFHNSSLKNQRIEW